MRKIILFAAIIGVAYLGLTGCFREIDPNYPGGGNDKPKPHNTVVGEWNWVKSVGGIGGWTHTPETTNKTMRLVLTANGEYKLYENGQLEYDLKYVLKRGSSWLYNDIVDFLITYERRNEKPGSEINRYIYSLNSTRDTLILAEECADCYTHTYVRIK